MDALKIIPQVFFDFIARIIPGILAMFLAAFLMEDSWKDYVLRSLFPLFGRQSDSISTVFLLILAYMIGHLISPLTKKVQYLWKKAKEKDFDSKKYEWLRVHQTEAGAHCAKLRAEFSMYNSFSAIFLIFSVLETGKAFLGNYYHFIIALILAVLAYFMQGRGKEGEGTFQKNVNNFYWACDGPIDLKDKEASVIEKNK